MNKSSLKRLNALQKYNLKNMKITFLGAAGGVTGSKHLVEVGGKRILLECGMHQGQFMVARKLNETLPFDVSTIDAVILSHAHIDHSGLLPVLAKQGYKGPIFATVGTTELVRPLFYDSAHIQVEDAAYYKQKALENPEIVAYDALYNLDDAKACLELFEPQVRGTTFRVADVADVTFVNAGHILGSAQVHIKAGDKSIAFTGDLGPSNRKILHDPVAMPSAQVMISESTYGGRIHKKQSLAREELKKVIQDTHSRGGKIIIPSFALERTQEILYDLHRLYDLKEIPRLPVFVDSPLATDFTKIFGEHLEDFDEETHEFFIDKNKNPFAFKGLTHTASTRESKKLNAFSKPCIIIAGSGMCEAGRVKHHLKHHIDDSRNTVLIVGYQAEHTLGRRIVDGEEKVRILGKMIDVRADVVSIRSYSAHADQAELITNVEKTPDVEHVFLVHGDDEQAELLKQKMDEMNKPWNVHVPVPGDSHEF